MPRQVFLKQLQISLNQTKMEQSWTFDKTILHYWL
jgi:leucyl/phenylalanyl-tRNA---protein transferase